MDLGEDWKNTFEKVHNEWSRLFKFYIRAAPVLKEEEIHDFVLSNNTFCIFNKSGADALVQMVRQLSQASYSGTVQGLMVILNNWDTANEDVEEVIPLLPNLWERCQGSYDGRDLPAFSAYRVFAASDGVASVAKPTCLSA